MKVVFAHAARFLVLTAVVLGVAAFSDWPRYRAVPEGVGYLTLSFSHGADRRAACRKLSPEEIAELPPNMRRKEICPRERPPIHVELEVNDETFFEAEVPPSGIAGDGPSRVFKRFELPEGRYEIEVHMRDQPGREAFDYSAERELHIEAAANRVIDFRPEAGGFVFY